jgi:predicted transcriptional regulator
MSYHIPSNDQIKDALKEVFKKNFRTVQSQNKLKNLVIKNLIKRRKKKNMRAGFSHLPPNLILQDQEDKEKTK